MYSFHHRLLFIVSLLLLSSFSFVQRPKTAVFDIQNYRFDVVLNDTSDVVRVTAIVSINYPNVVPDYTVLDFANTGMEINGLSFDGKEVDYRHQSDVLKVTTPSTVEIGGSAELILTYQGIPSDGLVISQNKHGERTFFAEHWPDRAHHWLPIIDHPSEKATCEFRVTAPAKYKVVSNGDLQNERLLNSDWKETIWKMSKPISAKVMVIGVAPFITRPLDDEGVITAWVYGKSKRLALHDFSEVPAIYEMLVDYMGEYPFSKCDQVESSTRFGGMENAGNIFYPEMSLTGEQKINKTIAHEIAHQWFGDAVTEADWADLWISEGFATYFENYWVEVALGMDSLLAKLEEEEIKILKYQRKNPHQMIVQQPQSNLNKLMNPMTYDKAGWMLRMLRYQVGEETFQKIVLAFYEQYKYDLASTKDFISIANSISDSDLNKLFRQWFYTPGAPDIRYNWSYKKGELLINFEQQTEFVYQLDFDIQIDYQNGSQENKRVILREKSQTIEWECDEIKEVKVDPFNIILGSFKEK
ncbi:MAG: M1 family metallopeptidase [Reichenbachiella sp.]|uniref:M1 family metallopeptidase n=1 Tax=Reichenbachiella sp. TaxID=2184521 RepID=UPI003299FFC9